MKSNKSLASQYGISQKNVTTNPSLGIGLNPNLNIEDQYIENLLKQTHFLNMEIKLMKQKQKENKGMGIMGLLNKDTNPVVSHAVVSNQKFSDMKSKLSYLVNNAEAQYLRLDDQNIAVKAQRDFTQKASLKQQQKNFQNKFYVDRELGQGIQKLKDKQKKLQQIRQENSRVCDHFSRVSKQWEQLSSKEQTKRLFKEILGSMDKETDDLKTKHFQIKAKQLEATQNTLNEIDQANKKDPQYIKLLEQNNGLLAQLKASQKSMFDFAYKVKQMEQLKKLSIRNKDLESELKKQAIQQAERLKKKLADKRGDFDLKLKQSKINLQTTDDIRILKGKVARRDKQIADLKKKTQISQGNYKKLRDQVTKLKKQQDIRIQSNKTKKANLDNVVIENNAVSSQLTQVQADHDKVQMELANARSDLQNVRPKFEDLEEQKVYLKAKEEFLKKQIDIQSKMKQMKIQQLGALMQSNTGLNQTISTLTQKWKDIQKFSTQWPSA